MRDFDVFIWKYHVSKYLHITMNSLIASDVSTGNNLVALQLIEAVLRIQPTVGAALPAVKGSTQLPLLAGA